MAVREEQCECKRWREELESVNKRIGNVGSMSAEIEKEIEAEKAKSDPDKKKLEKLEVRRRDTLALLKNLREEARQWREALDGCTGASCHAR